MIKNLALPKVFMYSNYKQFIRKILNYNIRSTKVIKGYKTYEKKVFLETK